MCKCVMCAKGLTRPQKLDHMELHPILSQAPFEKWGLDYVGPIKPTTYGTQAHYIVVATDYFTKWVEARVVRHADAQALHDLYMNKSYVTLVAPWR